MRDLIDSILPRVYLSELDEEYGILDVTPIVGSLDAGDGGRLYNEEVALQNKYAKKHVEGLLGLHDALVAMGAKIAELNEWHSSERTLRPCSKRTFVNRVAALRNRTNPVELFDTDPVVSRLARQAA